MTSRLRECDPAAEIYLFWVTSKYTESLQTLSILYLTNLTIQEASIFSWGQCIISVFVFAFPDPRTATWAFVPSVTSPIAAVLCYLLFIYLGPKFMANRKPFQLSFILMLYNAAMTILNLYMCVEVRPIPIVYNVLLSISHNYFQDDFGSHRNIPKCFPRPCSLSGDIFQAVKHGLELLFFLSSTL